MRALQDYGWLLLGAVFGVTLAFTRLGATASTSLSGIIPLPWGPIGIALLVFAGFAGLHFRLQLVRSLEDRRDHLERGAAASRLIHEAVADGRRWLRIVQENLEMVSDDDQAEAQRTLYLEGARANADKLEQAFERIEGNQRRLDTVSEDS